MRRRSAKLGFKLNACIMMAIDALPHLQDTGQCGNLHPAWGYGEWYLAEQKIQAALLSLLFPLQVAVIIVLLLLCKLDAWLLVQG